MKFIRMIPAIWPALQNMELTFRQKRFEPQRTQRAQRKINKSSASSVSSVVQFLLVIALIFLAMSAFAQTPSTKILYVGSVSINPCQDAKVLADWYTKFGIELKEYKGGYYGKIDTAGGLFAFGIHPKKADAPKQCASSVTVTYRVENFESSLAALKSKGLVPYKTEKEPSEGQFAYFHDPDGNEVNIWGK